MTATRCATCQAPLDPATGGVCPRCAMRLALGVRGAAPAEGLAALAPPAPAAGGTAARPAPGDRIGRYEIVEQVGEGGMGVVYRAVSKEPVRRDVALKLCKAPLDAHEVLARFEAERQALALLDHPAIATLLDGGTTDDGRPYFVMEFVDGLPVDAYADARKMTLAGRLRLFAAICDAVQHAHQNGIIHRDIKPTNVLVTERDGQPQPKVIDFGVAKAIAEPLTERTLFTHYGVLVGTPAYMSPEQLRRGAAAVDTRADVYSLGAVLYQLVTGAALVDPRALRGAAFDEIVRIVCDEEPRSLAERIRAQGDSASELADRRSTGVRELLRGVQGDLEWIVRRALAKDREERYVSAAELASDVRRLLAGEPTLAHPPSALYQLRKLVARHRAPFAAGLAALALGLAFVVVLAVQNRRLDAARTRALRTSEYLQGMLTWLDPVNVDGTTVSLEQVLDEASRRLDSELADAPEVALDVRRALGGAYLGQGHAAKSVAQFEQVLAIARATGDEDTITDAVANLAIARYHEGQPREARPLAEEAIARLRASGDPDDERVAQLLGILGEAAYRLGDLPEAARRLDEALLVQEATLARDGRPGDRELARRLATSGAIARRLGDTPKARARLDRAMAVIDAEDTRDEAQRAWCLTEIAALDRAALRFDDGEKHLAEALLTYERLYGADSPLAATTRSRQGEAALERYQFARALDVLTRAVAQLEAARGPQGAETVGARSTLAAVHAERGAADAALAIVRMHAPLHDALAAQIGRRPFRETGDRLTAARALLALGRAGDAETEARAALDLVVANVGPRHPLAAQAGALLARTLREQGHGEDAERTARAAVDLARATLLDGDAARAQAEATLGEILLDRGDCAGARAFLEPALAVLRPLLAEPSAARDLAQERASRLAQVCAAGAVPARP